MGANALAVTAYSEHPQEAFDFIMFLTTGEDFCAAMDALGTESFRWLGTGAKFWAMLAAFLFGTFGYYMRIYISGIEGIPSDLYEVATLDGASKPTLFFRITLPLMKGVFKTTITF